MSLLIFFSSRRRHTRCGRDWSSDVCSSDLVVLSLCVNSRGMLSEENMQNKITSKTVNRISYGVIFNYYQDIVMTSEVWSHVFIIKLPQKVFAEEQNFLETLHVGDAPAKALCMN